jgi:hypothetical protein
MDMGFRVAQSGATKPDQALLIQHTILSEELMETVFRHLDPVSLCRCMCVCKLWKQMLDEKSALGAALWSYHLRNLVRDQSSLANALRLSRGSHLRALGDWIVANAAVNYDSQMDTLESQAFIEARRSGLPTLSGMGVKTHRYNTKATTH